AGHAIGEHPSRQPPRGIVLVGRGASHRVRDLYEIPDGVVSIARSGGDGRAGCTHANASRPADDVVTVLDSSAITLGDRDKTAGVVVAVGRRTGGIRVG